MTVDDVDHYLAAAPEPQRSTLTSLRETIFAIVPTAEEGIAYGVPCFKLNGKGVAGVGSYANHCAYFPMSGSITVALADELKGFKISKGSISFAVDEPLPSDLVRQLIEARLREVEEGTK